MASRAELLGEIERLAAMNGNGEVHA